MGQRYVLDSLTCAVPSRVLGADVMIMMPINGIGSKYRCDSSEEKAPCNLGVDQRHRDGAPRLAPRSDKARHPIFTHELLPCRQVDAWQDCNACRRKGGVRFSGCPVPSLVPSMDE